LRRKGAKGRFSCTVRSSKLEKSYELGTQTNVLPFEILLQGVRPQAVR